VFDNAWERFTPFLAFPLMLRRVIYTTNSIESLNYQLRKIIKNRGHFPNDDAVIKLLWLAICTIEDKRARNRAKEASLRRGAKRKAEGHLVEGQTTTSWKQALAPPTALHKRLDRLVNRPTNEHCQHVRPAHPSR
jgi:putative transposase